MDSNEQAAVRVENLRDRREFLRRVRTRITDSSWLRGFAIAIVVLIGALLPESSDNPDFNFSFAGGALLLAAGLLIAASVYDSRGWNRFEEQVDTELREAETDDRFN